MRLGVAWSEAVREKPTGAGPLLEHVLEEGPPTQAAAQLSSVRSVLWSDPHRPTAEGSTQGHDWPPQRRAAAAAAAARAGSCHLRATTCSLVQCCPLRRRDHQRRRAQLTENVHSVGGHATGGIVCVGAAMPCCAQSLLLV